MHENGMNHRDFYLCHFLLDKDFALSNTIEDNTALFLIDLHRAQIRDKVPERWLVKDIGSLYFSALDIELSQRDVFRFIQYYSGSSLRESLLNRQDFWRKVQHRAAKLRDQ
jgi:heptose I phosphotransferase